jgi:hypothetical protein
MATRRTGADAYHGKRFTRQSLVGDRQPRDKSLALGGGFGPLPRALAAKTPQPPRPAPRGGGGVNPGGGIPRAFCRRDVSRGMRGTRVAMVATRRGSRALPGAGAYHSKCFGACHSALPG